MVLWGSGHVQGEKKYFKKVQVTAGYPQIELLLPVCTEFCA
jgi:hypothetical protein